MCYQRGSKVESHSICSTPAHLWAEDMARWWHHPLGGQCLSEGPCLMQEPSVRGCANLHLSLAPNPSVPSLGPLEPWDSRLASPRAASHRWQSPWRTPLFPIDSLSSRLPASPMACGHLDETQWAAWGCQLLGITPHAHQAPTLAERADEDDSHRRAVEPLKQNIHRSSTRASTSSFCLARWPPSISMKCLPTNCTAQPIHPAN